MSTTTFYHAGNIEGPIDPSKGRPRLDFNPSNRGGFYVITDKAQAMQWAEMRGHPSITKFDIPNSELSTLNIKTFDTADNEWADSTRKGRNNTLNHDYDAVSGLMLANPPAVKKGGAAKAKGSQFAIFTSKAAALFDKHKIKRCGK